MLHIHRNIESLTARLVTGMNIDRLVLDTIRNKCLIVSIWALPIHKYTIWHSKILSFIKSFPQFLNHPKLRVKLLKATIQ